MNVQHGMELTTKKLGMKHRRHRTLAVLFALGTLALSTALRLSLNNYIGLQGSFVVHFFAVVLCGLLGGRLAGVIATIGSVLLLAILWLPPIGSYSVAAVHDRVALVVFLVAASIVTAVSGYIRRRLFSIRDGIRVYEALLFSLENHALFAIDTHGFITSWNPGVASVFGYTEDEFTGRHFRDIFTEEDCLEKAPENEMESAALFGRAGDNRWHVKKDGSLFWGSGSLHPLKNRVGRIVGFVKIVQDQTELKTAVEQSERANREKDEFVSKVSHELRQPLNIILGWASILTRPSGVHRLEEAISTIKRAALEQKRLVEDLLEAGRSIEGAGEVLRNQVNLHEVIQEVVDSLEFYAQEHKVNLINDLPIQPLFVEGDADRLSQVVRNLVVNAIKFTPEDGTVAVHLEGEEEKATLVVTDTGEGIDPSFLPTVFEKFKQERPGQMKGFGLGLSIVKEIVDRHGGTVTAQSAGKGQGASFIVELPREH